MEEGLNMAASVGSPPAHAHQAVEAGHCGRVAPAPLDLTPGLPSQVIMNGSRRQGVQTGKNEHELQYRRFYDSLSYLTTNLAFTAFKTNSLAPNSGQKTSTKSPKPLEALLSQT